MSNPAAIPSPPSGRTFVVTMGLLSTLAAGLGVAGALALVRHLKLPPPPAPALAPAQPPAAPPPSHPEAAPAAPTIPKATPGRLVSPPEASALPGELAPVLRPGAIRDPELLELVELATALKRDGDTAGALKKLREADRRQPAQPRVLWELAAVYEAMALPEKSTAELVRLQRLGAIAGGEYFELANLALDHGSTTPPAANAPEFRFGKTSASPLANTGDGERVRVRMAIHSRSAEKVNPQDMSIIVEFYDIVDGTAIEETRSNPPASRWPTAPVDWGDAGSEIVEWEYHMPELDAVEVAAFGRRAYYGYVARLYYKDTLQDLIAEPRTLLARKSPAPGGLLDDSLFPTP